ncbi:MAG: arsenate reductase (glutaredoxin) [Alphaproteobacteria bacterium]|nr:arsenate reductase (glutaredoxin) [Alphaproteobacteria bacterium]MBE8220233.1 arsenate reductase (glutaredoxin) [Alphaproteobacteria bacterium]
MTKATLYHNRRCSKSRQALQLLQAANIDLTIIDYLTTPPDLKTLRSLQKMLSLPIRDLMRPKEALYKTLALANTTDEQDLLKAICAHPILLERPIFIYKDKAVIGRPPENVLDIL